jgi:hypothetical protein
MAGLRGDEDPTWLNAAVGRGQLVIVIAGFERCQSLRIGLGQDGFTGVQDGRNPRDPLHGCLGELLEVGCTIEGAIRHQKGHAFGCVPLMHMGANRLANVLSITVAATGAVSSTVHTISTTRPRYTSAKRTRQSVSHHIDVSKAKYRTWLPHSARACGMKGP